MDSAARLTAYLRANGKQATVDGKGRPLPSHVSDLTPAQRRNYLRKLRRENGAKGRVRRARKATKK